jgi:hypothetical protein
MKGLSDMPDKNEGNDNFFCSLPEGGEDAVL